MTLNTVILTAFLLQCVGAQPRIGQALLGYIYDPDARALRAVRGVPGAALLAEPLDTGFEIAAAAIAPQRDYALAVSASVRETQLVRWTGNGSSVVPVDGATGDPDRLLFSSSGTAALLFNSASARLQLVTGFPDSPAARDLPAGSDLTAPVFAIADDGTVAFAGAGAIRVIAPDLSSFALPLPADLAALAFAPSGLRLLALTRAGDVYVADRMNAGLDLRAVASNVPGIGDTVAARFSPDGAAAVAVTAAGVVSMVDLDSGTVQALSCGCAATALEPFGHPGLFRLSDISSRPIMLFETASDSPRFWFIPADTPRREQ